jgi:hypothetical protein
VELFCEKIYNFTYFGYFLTISSLPSMKGLTLLDADAGQRDAGRFDAGRFDAGQPCNAKLSRPQITATQLITHTRYRRI